MLAEEIYPGKKNGHPVKREWIREKGSGSGKRPFIREKKVDPEKGSWSGKERSSGKNGRGNLPFKEFIYGLIFHILAELLRHFAGDVV